MNIQEHELSQNSVENRNVLGWLNSQAAEYYAEGLKTFYDTERLAEIIIIILQIA